MTGGAGHISWNSKLKQTLSHRSERNSSVSVSLSYATRNAAQPPIASHPAFSTAPRDMRMARESISSAEERLKAVSPLLFRAHRGYIVNTARIVSMTRTSVTMKGGETLPLARGKYDALARAVIGGGADDKTHLS